MSIKYRRLLFIILYLLMRLRQVERDTNDMLDVMEQRANDRLKELADKQIAEDERILRVWEDNVQILLDENEKLRAKLKRKK